jgi:site-specific recombinase
MMRRIRRQHGRSWVLGVAAVVALGLVGACVGYLFAAVVAVAGRV